MTVLSSFPFDKRCMLISFNLKTRRCFKRLVQHSSDDGPTLFSTIILKFKSIFFNNSFWHYCALNADILFCRQTCNADKLSRPTSISLKLNDAIEFREVSITESVHKNFRKNALLIASEKTVDFRNNWFLAKHFENSKFAEQIRQYSIIEK